MKLVEVEITGLSLFYNNKFKINFLNKSRVSLKDDSEYYEIFSGRYLPNTVAILGNNATGKTSTLKLIKYTIESLFHANKINDLSTTRFIKDNIIDKDITINLVLFSDNEYVKLQSNIRFNQVENCLAFTSERMLTLNEFIESQRKINKNQGIKNKTRNEMIKDFLKFEIDDNINNIREYNKKEIDLTISDQISIFSFIRRFKIYFLDTMSTTNLNLLEPSNLKIHKEWIEFLDSSIKNITPTYEDDELKYIIDFNNSKTHVIKEIFDTNEILSSGTSKSINIFQKILRVLKTGGYLFIDEIENHLNQVIIREILYLFKNASINKNNATLIISTHYVEILDEISRNDNILYTSKENGFIKINNLHDNMNRTDLKKSMYYNYALDEVGIEAKAIQQLRNTFRGVNE